MQAKTTSIAGSISASVGAVNPTDLPQWQQVQALAAGLAEQGGPITVSQITDLAAQLPVLMAAALVDSASVGWVPGPSGTLLAEVQVAPGGGALVGESGLYVNLSGVYSPVGHQHSIRDIPDADTWLPGEMALVMVNTDTVTWSQPGPQNLEASVNVAPSSGLLAGPDGLALDWTQVASLSGVAPAIGLAHPPLSMLASRTLVVSFNAPAQQLGLEVNALAGSGLLATLASGVQVDFGAGHNQAARGDAVAALQVNAHPPVTVINTLTLQLGISAGQVLSGVVNVDPMPPDGCGLIAVGVDGLSVVLGTDADTAAAGNHGHPVVTMSSDGFMSPALLAEIQAMQGLLSGVPVNLVEYLSGVMADAVTSVNGETGPSVTLTTTNVAEGTNEYFTTLRAEQAAISAPLTGLVTTVGGAVVATDSILTAMGRLQCRVALDDAKADGATRVQKAGDTMSGALQFSGAANPGLALNNLSSAQRTALADLTGNLVFDTTLGQAWLYQGSAPGWINLLTGNAGILITGSGAPGATPGLNGNYYFDTSTGNLYEMASGSWSEIYSPTTVGGGTAWLYGSGAPGSGAGANGNYYLDTATGNLYLKSSGSWSVIYTPSSTSTSWLNGNGAPSSGTGSNGNYYLDDATGNIYQKASGAWTIISSPPVAILLNGTGAPSSGLGANGNYYLDGSTGNIYLKSSGSWSIIYSPTLGSGTTWISGSGAPSSGLGSNGTYYLDDATGIIYLKSSGSWSAIYTPASAGTAWLNGSGAPGSGAGANGNYYVDDSTGIIYVKTSGSWSAVYTPAAPGTTWLNGSGAPGSGTGANGNYYVDDSTGIIYVKTSGSWSAVYTPASGGGLNGTGSAPTIAVVTGSGGAGASATADLSEDTNPTQTAFRVKLVVGSGASASGTYFTVTFATAFAYKPKVVWACNTSGFDGGFYVDYATITTGGFSLKAFVSMPAGTYSLDFLVMG